MNILGINAYHGNASAAIVCDGKLVAAVEEERFNRVKYAAGFPTAAIRYCLKEARLTSAEIDHVAVPRNPYARLGTKLFYAVRMPSFARERIKVMSKFTGIPEALAQAFDTDAAKLKATFHRVEHHQAHLASTYFVSPFEHAALLSADGLGDFREFDVGSRPRQSDAHRRRDRVSALAGTLLQRRDAVPGIPEIWRRIQSDGPGGVRRAVASGRAARCIALQQQRKQFGFQLGLEYFTHHKTGPEMSWAESDKTPVLGKMFSDAMPKKLGVPARQPDDPLEQRHRDLAASLQARLEEVYLGMLKKLAAQTGAKAVCLAGGVAFNCVANGKIFDTTPFEKVYVHPAAGDAGLAVGAAYHVWHQTLGKPRSFVMEHAYWGPGYTPAEVRCSIEASAVSGGEGYTIHELGDDELMRRTAGIIAEGKIVGWYQGRAEWGPRALGNRSIVADPRRAEMKEILNRRIKHREIFRPFAPSILAEKTGEWLSRSPIPRRL